MPAGQIPALTFHSHEKSRWIASAFHWFVLLILTLTLAQNILADALSRMNLIDFVAAGRPLDLAAAVKPVSWKARKLGSSHCARKVDEKMAGSFGVVCLVNTSLYGINYQRRHLV